MRSTVLLMAALVLVGCPSDDDVAGETPVKCDPLEMDAAPIELGNVLAVGKAADGTLYVIDEDADAPGDPRVFVSAGLALQRREVSGSGEESVEGGVRRLSLLVPGDAPFTLFAEIKGEKASRMLVVLGELRIKELDISQQSGGETLEVVDDDALAGLRVRNLPGDVTIEYSARVMLEEYFQLVVTRPTHDWSYDDFRVFFGANDALEERPVTSVMRAKDGGSTWVRFSVDTEPAEAFFASQLKITPDAELKPDTFESSGTTLPMERLPQDEPDIDGLSFTCLR